MTLNKNKRCESDIIYRNQSSWSMHTSAKEYNAVDMMSAQRTCDRLLFRAIRILAPMRVYFRPNRQCCCSYLLGDGTFFIIFINCIISDCVLIKRYNLFCGG